MFFEKLLRDTGHLRGDIRDHDAMLHSMLQRVRQMDLETLGKRVPAGGLVTILYHIACGLDGMVGLLTELEHDYSTTLGSTTQGKAATCYCVL